LYDISIVPNFQYRLTNVMMVSVSAMPVIVIELPCSVCLCVCEQKNISAQNGL